MNAKDTRAHLLKQSVLTVAQVETILEDMKDPTVEFLNALTRRIQYEGEAKKNPGRPERLINHLKIVYETQFFDWEDAKLFEDILRSPSTHLNDLQKCKSIVTMIDIFEQMALHELTKQMYFLQKSSVFEQCCVFLAENMIADEAHQLLTLLINDKALHPLIPSLLSKRSKTGNDLIGYQPMYMQMMLDPNADQELKNLLLPFGRLIIEKNTGSVDLAEHIEMLIQIEQGVDLSLGYLTSVMKRVKDEKLKQQMLSALEKYTPNTAIMYAAQADDTANVIRIFKAQEDKLNQQTIRKLDAWAKRTNQLKAEIAARVIPDVDYTADHHRALSVLKEKIDRQEKRSKKALVLSLIGLLMPIISHIIILIWYLVGKEDVAKLQLDHASFITYKKREKKPEFNLETYEKTKPVLKKTSDQKSSQRKLIEMPASDNAPVSLFFDTKKQANAFKKKVNDWAKVDGRQIKMKTC